MSLNVTLFHCKKFDKIESDYTAKKEKGSAVSRAFFLGGAMITTEKFSLIETAKLIPYANNARTHTKEQIKQIQASLREFGFVNPLLVDSKLNVLAGHGRLMAAQAEGLEKVPCVFVEHLTETQKKAYILADNRLAELSTWDNSSLLEELNDLKSLDLNMTDFGFDISAIELRRKSWARTEKYCDLKRKFETHSCGRIIVTSFYKVGKRGIPITKIKEDQSNAQLFADNLCNYLEETLGSNLTKCNWCLLTTPRRRHKEGFHFATAICELSAKILGLPFYKDAIVAENRDRINPDFRMLINPKEPNVILYDDIISTGETLRTVRKMLLDEGHVVLPLVGIKNQTMERK